MHAIGKTTNTGSIVAPNKLFAALIIVLTACAAPPDQTAENSLVDPMTQRTFAAGYQQISDRYIEPVPVTELAIAGLNGLKTIDPSLEFRQDEGRIRLFLAGTEAAPARTTSRDDAAGWAALTAEEIGYARLASTRLQTAPMEDIYEAVFDGMLATLDPFSSYAGGKQARENRAKRTGYGGIGLLYSIGKDGVTVVEVFRASPAEKAGIKAGDRVTHIDKQALAGLDRYQINSLFRGRAGSIAMVGLWQGRSGFPTLLAVERAHITYPTVRARLLDDNLLLRVSSFNNHTAEEIVEEVKRAQQTVGNLAGLILDLRDNPGGLLSEAVKVSDLFLDQGRIVSTWGRHPHSRRDYDAHFSDIANGKPIVILVDGKSASASEIVAAALQDNERAVIVGSGSFGKGTVQRISRLPNNGEMTLTWSRFVAPSGYLLHGLGIAPTVCTSGSHTGDPQGSAAAVIKTALNHAAEFADRLEKWRTVSFEDHGQRKALRGYCPAGEARGNLEIEVAQRLLADSALYRRIVTSRRTVAANPAGRG